MESSDYQNSDRRNRSNGFPKKYSCKKFILSIETLMEGMETENRQKMSLNLGMNQNQKDFLCNFRTIRILMQVSKYATYQPNAPLHVWSGRLRAQLKKSIGRISILILNMELYQYSENFLENSNYQDFDERFKVHKVSTESSDRKEKFLIEISMNEVKPVVAERHQFECRREPKLIAIPRLLNYQDSDTRIETDSFSWERLPLVKSFQLRLCRKKSCKYVEKWSNWKKLFQN